MKHSEWIRSAYIKSCEAIAKCYNSSHIDGWSENHITTSVLESIESLGLELNWSDKPQKIKWEGFKLKGIPENKCGDIAVVVRVWVTSTRFVDGISFYEAKRQYYREDNKPIGFSSLKVEQLSRIHEHTYASSILLYDVDLEDEIALASSVSMPFVKELAEAKLADSSGRMLHHFGEPWVVSLANNLLGLHLDFRADVVKDIKASTTSYRKPTFIINASVALSHITNLTLDNSFIKKNEYEHLIKDNVSEPNIKKNPREDNYDI